METSKEKYYEVKVSETFRDMIYVKADCKEDAEGLAGYLMHDEAIRANELGDNYKDATVTCINEVSKDEISDLNNVIVASDMDEGDIDYGYYCIKQAQAEIRNGKDVNRYVDITRYLERLMEEEENESMIAKLQKTYNTIEEEWHKR